MKKDREQLEMEVLSVNKPTGNLRELIILCNDNIKGLSRREDIKKYLPIDVEDFSIEEENNKLVFKQDNEVIKNVWIDTNCYSNLEILKVIAKIYKIEYNSEWKYHIKVLKKKWNNMGILQRTN